LAQERPAAAAHILSERYEITARAGFVWYAAETRTLQALAAPTTDEALAFLTQALPLAEREGCVRMFVDLGELMMRLLREAAARRLAPEYVGRLLATFRTEAHRGGQHPPAHIEQPLAEPLSERELSVLRILAEHTNREIGAALCISDNTVKAHLKSIYGKLGVGSRRDAVVTARTLGLLS
jgi:LuxR family maltose regulon positive regulatory protein